MDPVQTVTMLPESEREVPNYAAEIRVHQNGRFVYASNRGNDTIAVFEVNPDNGTLTMLEREPVRGSWPRSFHIGPGGKWLLAGGQRSNTISVFSIDPDSGMLVFSGTVVNCPSPISLVFHRPR